MADPHVQALVMAMLDRDYHVTDAKMPGRDVILTFDMVKGVGLPQWLKAFELPRAQATPNGFELEVARFQIRVLSDIANGRPGVIVRRMIAEHGSAWVVSCLSPRHENV